ncbi:MAG: flagellar basal-body rod protein FlgG [Alphaproteobacteria bacterium]|jgi:flagellar basal-body rod protein FlgG|nr:flagellar basal-body rod protein FlgG [Thalassospira sp.]MCE2965325.1 flagellar basal-body rod protein FlgG [Alphaproteobacteria bacterium]
MRSLSIGASGMLAQQTNVEVISNNIANMTTTGYKRQRAEFQDLLYQNQRRVGSTSSAAGTIVPSGIQLGLGVKTASTYRITQQGSLQETQNDFDIAINGTGYFQIELPSGEVGYTRAGSFQLSPAGEIVTQDGYRVLPGITVPNDARGVTINDAGEVLVKLDGQVAEANVGQLQIAAFANEAGLEAIGGNMFLESPASGAAIAGVANSVGYGKIMQGFLEASNVNVVSEITSLITAQRAYEMNSKVIKTTDEMMQTTSQVS